MTPIAIEVNGLSKKYRLGAAPSLDGSMRELIYDIVGRIGLRRKRRRAARSDFWALKNVSFEVRQGEVIGVIGRNGAGKSTLLKVLSRITDPTEGYVEIDGRIGSLLEVGTGFHPELTGRENIYLNGTILGMRRREIDQRFDQIVDFSGVEQFLDTPVKRYSSGMRVRLAFAVAAHLDPEILIVDEVLAVGDASFQAKCLGRIRQVADDAGCTVMFVSHNMASVQSLCDRCLMLRDGSLVVDGTPESVVDAYLRDVSERAGEAVFGPDTARYGSGEAKLNCVRLLDDHGQRVTTLPMGRGLTVELHFDLQDHVLSDPSFAVTINSTTGQPLMRLATHETHGPLPAARSGGIVRLQIDRMDLMPGTYYLTVDIQNKGVFVDRIEDAVHLEVVPWQIYPTGKVPPARCGLILFAPCRWTTDYAA